MPGSGKGLQGALDGYVQFLRDTDSAPPASGLNDDEAIPVRLRQVIRLRHDARRARRNPSCIGTGGFWSIGAAANQFGQLLSELGSGRGGLGLEGLTAAELTDLPALSACDA